MKRIYLAFFLMVLPLFCFAAPDGMIWKTYADGDGVVVALDVKPGWSVEDKDIRFTTTMEEDQLDEAGPHVWRFVGDDRTRLLVSYVCCNGDTCMLPRTVDLLEGTTVVADGEMLVDGLDCVRSHSGYMSKNQLRAWLADGAEPDEEGASLDGRLLLMVCAALVGGFLLNLTPCVLPLIPVNIAIIAGGRRKEYGFVRGLVYGAGIAIFNGVVGGLFVLTGGLWGAMTGNAAFNIVVSLLFMIMALAMADVLSYVPAKWRTWLPDLRKAGIFGVFLMGGVAALLSSACVAPVTTAVVVHSAACYAQGEHSALVMPFLVGLGMSVPWPLVGAGIDVMPKPGRFMIWIRYVFAAILVGASIYYFSLGWNCLMLRRSFTAEMANLDRTLARSRVKGRPVLVYCWATWCRNCEKLSESLASKEARQLLSHFDLVKLQVENPKSEDATKLLRNWGVGGLPALVVLKEQPFSPAPSAIPKKKTGGGSNRRPFRNRNALDYQSQACPADPRTSLFLRMKSSRSMSRAGPR
ncbi:MAG: thioredoxin family protein [Victivallaceae bacterium]|nr:thioredoxin family protein [Victivallaceae bacterium]